MHTRPFKCARPHPNCRRSDQGFTTINDLNRHYKTVHKLGATENVYVCAADECKGKDKIWPRLDNFKQHIGRIHKEYTDMEELIRRYVHRLFEAHYGNHSDHAQVLREAPRGHKQRRRHGVGSEVCLTFHIFLLHIRAMATV